MLLVAVLLLIGFVQTSPIPIDGLSEIADAAIDQELDNASLVREKRDARRGFSRFGAPAFVAAIGK